MREEPCYVRACALVCSVTSPIGTEPLITNLHACPPAPPGVGV